METMDPRQFKKTFGFKPSGVFNVEQNLDDDLKKKIKDAHPRVLVTQEFGALTDAEKTTRNYMLIVRWTLIGKDVIKGYIDAITLFNDDAERDQFLITLKNKKDGFPALRKN
jgi:hypothetical protein